MSQLQFDISLRKPSFELHASAVVATAGVIGIIGASGAGKSSLLRSLAGLEPDCSGRIQLDKECWLNTAESLQLPVHQRGVGMVFQQPSLLSHLTVAGNLAFAWRRASSARRVTLSEVAEQLGITHLLERMPAHLSGGEAQRVAIARALVTGPRLLMLDEPLSAIDAEGRRDVMSCLERLRKERPVPMLYVSHNLDEVARLADTLLLLEGGRIVAQGPVAELLTRMDLPLAYAPDAEAIIEGRVSGHDEAEHVTQVAAGSGRILLARQKIAIGERLRLRIQARDVSLALSRASDSSILNILPCTVREISEAGVGQCLVRLTLDTLDEQLLLARVTQRSVQHLSLQPGMALFAQIKSVALA